MVAPVVPLGGIGGLAFLDRTYDRQFAAFLTDPEITRDLEAFRERASQITSSEELVRDTRVLRVVLGAYGLEDELPKRALLRKVIDEGTVDPRSLGNRLADPAWRNMARAIGLGNGENGLLDASVVEDIAERYRTRAFERAVGNADTNMRLALNFRREIGELAASPSVESAGWFRIMGSPPLRSVVEAAFGLSEQFGQIDIDRQRDELERLSRARFGESSPSVFTDPERVEEVIRDFLVRAQIEEGPSLLTPGFTALSILQGSTLGPSTASGLFTSRFL